MFREVEGKIGRANDATKTNGSGGYGSNRSMLPKESLMKDKESH